MDKFENADFKNSFAGWQSSSAFNTYWQYSFVNRSAFYANIRGEYRDYMTRWVQNYLWWYDGWVPYFHSTTQGLFSTKIASALVNGAARKVVGGRIFFKTKNEQKHLEKDEKGEYPVNKALSFVNEWATESHFTRELKKAVTFAAAAGTSLLKLDKCQGKLKAKALRFDSFYPTVGFNGQVVEVYCFIKDFTKITNFGKEGDAFDNFYVVEHRYFGDYTKADGTLLKNVPIVSYEIRKSRGIITSGQEYSVKGESIEFKSLPKDVRSTIGKAFDGIMFDSPQLLPFLDNIGCELINWTDCVSSLPELPFGESMLFNIMPYLMSYDYYWSAFNTDLYLGRGRVLIPKEMQSPKAAESNEYNSGLDSMLFVKIAKTALGDNYSPVPLQFDLRTSSWQEARTMIIQNISINTGLNLATIASFLQDSNAARTAREISTEESETALFVDDKREIIERPINRLLKIVTLYYGYADDIVIRWSSAGLSNIYTRTEMIATALSAGFISPQKAVRMFNQDDDEYALQEEFDRIKENKENDFVAFGGNEDIYGGINEDSEQTSEQSIDSGRGDGSKNPFNSERGVFEENSEAKDRYINT
jgi:hypothetical protein